ncbi:MAG: flagellar hook-basal body complex protein FliE [Bacteroidota bacterium]
MNGVTGMVINEMEASKLYSPLVQQQTRELGIRPSQGVKFTDTLNELVGDVNSLQKESSDMTASFIKGEPVDLHDVMISAQKAKTSFELLLELRYKTMDLYREVSRIQV